MTSRTRTWALAALVVPVLALAGCSSSSSSPTTTQASTATTGAPATIDTVPTADRSAAGTAGSAPTVSPVSGTPANVEVDDLIPGTGTEAKLGDQVTVQYVLADTSGKVIQSSWTSQPATFTLSSGGLIPGWVTGIPGMKVGGRRELVIPGAEGRGSRPMRRWCSSSTS
jgi:FKBP-type peptidyl-prolyl cis-trans isomerase